jgi:hypothetical protein
MDLAALLRGARTVAVLGAHHEPHRPAFYVPDALHRAGVTILPVNERLLGRTLWGQPVRATLAELRVPVDIVDVFRRGEDVPAHLDDLLAMSPRPGCVWLQSGIRSTVAAEALAAVGVAVVQDRCLMVDHARLVGRATGS